jgi:head-tail adaptor
MALSRHASGERDRLVTIQKLPDPEATEDTGYPREEWRNLTDMIASRIELGGQERFTANQVSAPYDTRWQIPYRPDMDPEVIDVPKLRRLVVRGRVHNIVEAMVLGRYYMIELLTQSGPRL